MDEYFHILKDFISIPDNSTVVEIAPGTGLLFKYVISEFNYSKYIGIEPDIIWVNKFQENLLNTSKVTLINDIYENVDLSNKDIDIVISAGLLYHLASPAHYIEYLCNIGADVIYLESYGHLEEDVLSYDYKKWSKVRFVDEQLNISGNRQVKGKKALPVSVALDINICPHLFKMLGYKMEYYKNIDATQRGKQQVCIMKFIK